MTCSNKPVNDTNFFNWRSSEYDGDKALFGSGVSEIINSFGVLSGYYIVDMSVENNKLFGEDNDRNLIRKFPLMVQFELPEEIELLVPEWELLILIFLKFVLVSIQ